MKSNKITKDYYYRHVLTNKHKERLVKLDHAYLSASASERWLNCPKSLNLPPELQTEERSFYADEGTLAHNLAENKLRDLLFIENKTMDGNVPEEMQVYTDMYISYILQKVQELDELEVNPRLFIEKRVYYTAYAKDGFGTVDFLIIADDRIVVIDFKYGKGVPVRATTRHPRYKFNTQLAMYALGVYQEYGAEYNFKTVELHIVQPRIKAPESTTITLQELLDFGEWVRDQSVLAWNDEGEFKKGSWCKFCKKKGTSHCKVGMITDIDLDENGIDISKSLESILGSWNNE